MLPQSPRDCDTYLCPRPAEFGALHCALHQQAVIERQRKALERRLERNAAVRQEAR